MAAYGPENIKDHFAAFDTICDATQVRQDAVLELSTNALSAEHQDLDFILVVGGWDSSNTCHLLEIPHEEVCPLRHSRPRSVAGLDSKRLRRAWWSALLLLLQALCCSRHHLFLHHAPSSHLRSQGLLGYHVNEAKCIRPDNSVEWRDVDGNILVTESFLPLDRPVRIGVTSGASTPDSVVQECLEAIVMVKQLASEEMIAGSGEPRTYSPDEEAPAAEASQKHEASDAPSGAASDEVADMAPPSGFAWGGTY